MQNWVIMEQAGTGSARVIQRIPPYRHQQMLQVCGRDLEETHHPGGHSDEVLPAAYLTPLAANVLSPCCITSLDCFPHCLTPAVVSLASLAKSNGFGICPNFSSYCRAEGLPMLLAPHTEKQQIQSDPTAGGCTYLPLQSCLSSSFTSAPNLSPRQSTEVQGKGWWKQGLREALHISLLPLSNAKIISLRRSCLSDGEAKRFFVMAVGLIQFGSLIQQSIKYALSLITANLVTCIKLKYLLIPIDLTGLQTQMLTVAGPRERKIAQENTAQTSISRYVHF